MFSNRQSHLAQGDDLDLDLDLARSVAYHRLVTTPKQRAAIVIGDVVLWQGGDPLSLVRKLAGVALLPLLASLSLTEILPILKPKLVG